MIRMAAQKKTTPISFKSELLLHINTLKPDDREIFDRIYEVWETVGKLDPPKEMHPWIKSTFGDLAGVKKQEFLKITNYITYEGAIFNELRTKRPLVGDKGFDKVLEQIEASRGGPFSHPQTHTPADTFGRVKGKYCITGSNVAKYDGQHGLIISNAHDPLLFSRRRVRDYFHVARRWYKRAHKESKAAVYPLYTWNCLWRAGASIIHAHCHLVLAEHQAYAKVEELRRLSLEYQEKYQSNYFDDIFNIHKKMGLGFERGDIKLLTKITPIKEKEVMIFSHEFNDGLADIVSDTLTTMKEKLGVSSFNLSIVLPPLEDTPEVWEHMPVLVRIVDRGKLSSQTADVGAMELYAQSVIGSNPYVVFDKLKKALL